MSTAKKCIKCLVIQDLNYFHKTKASKDGRVSECKQCVKIRTDAHYSNNRERIKQRANGYYHSNKERCLASIKAYTKSLPFEIRTKPSKKYRESHREQCRETSKLHRKNNPHMYTADAANRRAIKRQRCPKWLSEEHKKQMRDIYKDARQRGMHVDHIVPLIGEFVSGLHVPWNLQPLYPADNLAKSNTFIW